MVDPDAVRAWRDAGDRERILLELANDVPEILARAASESLQLAFGFDKRRLAGVLVGAWSLGTAAVLDHLREQCASVPEMASSQPEQIERLLKINRG